MSGLLGEVESLYAVAVMSPNALTEHTISDWFDGVAATTQLDKPAAKLLRRLVRTAQKLSLFWRSDTRVGDLDLDWRTRVDIAMGPRAWRPVLDLSQHILAEQPSEETFESVRELFRIVNGDVWLEGVGYEEWLQDAGRT